jgi:alpha-glucosidase (family GH31 glycosyl hydrolase)
MLGENILVAPAVVEGAVIRDLPSGSWKSRDGTIHEGPIRFRDYPVPPEALPFFVRQ